MTAAQMSVEFEIIGFRTHRFLAVSVGAHVLLFLVLILAQKFAPEVPTLTEITWIDPVEAVAAPAMPVAQSAEEVAAPEVAVSPPTQGQKSEHVPRQTEKADFAPKPQKLDAVDNTISQRLVALQEKERHRPDVIATTTKLSTPSRPRLAGVSDELRASKPENLTRQQRTPTAPIELKRGKKRIQAAQVLATPTPEPTVTRSRPKKSDSYATRDLAGARLTGPVSDRPIVSMVKPTYPDWAKVEGVEGSVMVQFFVLPDGRVKENVMIEKTSGFANFDNNAVAAILKWRFEPLNGATGEQWGSIMFHYRLE